jgi:uncharacterized membrane protein YcjF (UPF0283 family)
LASSATTRAAHKKAGAAIRTSGSGTGIAALGCLAFIAGAAFFVLIWRRRPWLATAAIVVGFASVLAMVKPLTSEWIDHLDRRSPDELLLMTASVFAPVFAVLLTVPEMVRRREG